MYERLRWNGICDVDRGLARTTSGNVAGNPGVDLAEGLQLAIQFPPRKFGNFLSEI